MPCWAISWPSRATSPKSRYESRSMKVTSASVDFPAALAIVREGGSLDADASARVFETIMSGVVPEADLTAFLTAQAVRGPTVPEIVGAVRAMRAGMRPVAARRTPSICAAPAATVTAHLISQPPCPLWWRARHTSGQARQSFRHLQSGAPTYWSSWGEDRPGTGARFRRFSRDGHRLLFAQVHHPHAPCRKSAQPDQDAHHLHLLGRWLRPPG